MDEGRKRVLLIAASILVARHLKELNSAATRTPALESLISNAIAVATPSCRRSTATSQANS
jgi:hypothetical protein